MAQRPDPDLTLGLIWAQSTGGVIGRDGGLPWHLPEDLAHFRRVTSGHPVIMGRRTWESLPDRFRPLPDRHNIVVSRRRGFTAPGAEVAGSLPEALALAAGAGAQAWVAGGGGVYRAARGIATVAEVTEIDVAIDGDTFAPSLADWTLQHTGDWRTSATGLRYRFLRYRRASADPGAQPSPTGYVVRNAD